MVKHLIFAGAAVVFVGGVYWYGYSSGRNDGKIEQLEASIQAERDRKDVDKEVAGLDDYALCIRVGGLPEQCDELRRMDAAAAD